MLCNVILHAIIIVAPHPFIGTWPLFKFLNSIRTRYDSSDGGSARCKVATYIQDNTDTFMPRV
jgi:hypothetical protein